jgi:hypothetical protein
MKTTSNMIISAMSNAVHKHILTPMPHRKECTKTMFAGPKPFTSTGTLLDREFTHKEEETSDRFTSTLTINESVDLGKGVSFPMALSRKDLADSMSSIASNHSKERYQLEDFQLQAAIYISLTEFDFCDEQEQRYIDDDIS